MNIVEELSHNGVSPTGPVSAWPKERHDAILAHQAEQVNALKAGIKVKASPIQMAKGLVKNVGQAMAHGRVSKEIREERYDTCKSCPFFIEDSKRCSECGCFMEAKTWIGGDPDALCPKQKWSR